MQVTFEACDPDADHLQPSAERRVRLALRRLSWLAPRARVQLSNVSGARGGVDKRCQIELATDTTDTVIVASIARDWRSALQSAVTRAARALLHNWQYARRASAVQRRVLAIGSSIGS